MENEKAGRDRPEGIVWLEEFPGCPASREEMADEGHLAALTRLSGTSDQKENYASQARVAKTAPRAH